MSIDERVEHIEREVAALLLLVQVLVGNQSSPAAASAGPESVEATSLPVVASPYFTVEEAAAYLRTTKQGVYSLVKRGRLHPEPGRPGRLLFTRKELDRYLGNHFRR